MDLGGEIAPRADQALTNRGDADRAVLLAGSTGRPGHGVEKALYALDALDALDHTPTLLLGLPNTTRVTGLARADDGTVYLLTDIRGNEQAPRPHLLRVTLPAGCGDLKLSAGPPACWARPSSGIPHVAPPDGT